MLYTATTDGQLHAFKVSASVTSDTFTTDTQHNNELWSFLPPYVLPELLPNYNSQQNLLDGPVVWADVPSQAVAPSTVPSGQYIYRAGAQQTNVGWRRVLVGSGGYAPTAPNGSYYYALDITDPTTPIFLWQLAKDGVGNWMFGNTTPTPAIASVSILLPHQPPRLLHHAHADSCGHPSRWELEHHRLLGCHQ